MEIMKWVTYLKLCITITQKPGKYIYTLIQLFQFFTCNYNFQKTIQQSYKILKAKKKKDLTIQFIKKNNDDNLF